MFLLMTWLILAMLLTMPFLVLQMARCVNELKLLMNKLESWLNMNGMSPKISAFFIKLYGETVAFVESFKYLGVIIDSKLTFSNHVEQICIRLSRIKGLCYNSSGYFSLEAKLLVYYARLLTISSFREEFENTH